MENNNDACNFVKMPVKVRRVALMVDTNSIAMAPEGKKFDTKNEAW